MRCVHDYDSGASMYTEVRDNRTYSIVTDLKEVGGRRFATTGLVYTVRFTDTFGTMGVSHAS